MVKMTYYDKISRGYEQLHREEQLKKIFIILDFVDEDDKILDVGCGTGFYSKYFKNYKGIDNSVKLIKNNKYCSYGKAEELEFEDKSFDVVICVTAIHNFDDYEKALNEMKRVRKKKVIISLLKKSSKFDDIKKAIKKRFKVKEIDEEKDVIFVEKLVL